MLRNRLVEKEAERKEKRKSIKIPIDMTLIAVEGSVFAHDLS